VPEEWPEEGRPHLGPAGDQGPARPRRFPDELHIGKPLSLEEGFHNILRGLTDARGPGQPEPCRLGRRLRGDRPSVQAEQPCRPGQRQPAQERPPGPACSMFGSHMTLLSHSDRAHGGVDASVERLGRDVNHGARCYTPAVATRSASIPTSGKEILARFVRGVDLSTRPSENVAATSGNVALPVYQTTTSGPLSTCAA